MSLLPFNDLERRLKDSDPQVRYIIQNMHEQMRELLHEFDEMTKMLVQFAEILQGFDAVNRKTLDKIKRIGNRDDDGLVHSVANDPEDLL